MTVDSNSSPRANPVRLDGLLALPIAIKLSIGLIVVLFISGYVIDTVARQVVNSSQRDLVFSDLQAISRAESFRVADIVAQELTVLARFSEEADIQTALRERAEAVPVNEIYQPAPDVLTSLEDLITTREEFSTAALINPNGVVLGISPIPEELSEANPDQWLWFDSAARGQTYISTLEEDNLSGQTGIVIAVPIIDRTDPSNLLGVLQVVWNFANVSTAGEITDREISIAEQDGTVLVSTGTPAGTAFPRSVREQLFMDAEGAFAETASSGTEYLYGYSSLNALGLNEGNPVSQVGWLVVARAPASAADDNAALVLSRLRVALVTTVVGSVVAIVFLSRFITNPLIRLTDTAAELATGDLSAPIPNLPNDEVGQLANVLRSLVDRLVYRVRQLNAAVQVSRATAATLEVEQMLTLVTRALVEQFSLPEVRVFLLEPSGNRANLRMALGPESERLMRSDYSVHVDERTLPGRAILLREEQAASTDSPAFAGSKGSPAELALPLLSGGEIYGALHLIGEKPGAFAREDIDILTLIADQIASSVKNARLFEQSIANLREIETLNRRLTQEAWREYLDESRSMRYTLDANEEWPVVSADDLSELIADRDVIRAETYNDEEGRRVLVAPLLLRGEAIGVLAVSRPQGSIFTQDEISLMESIASRMALIAESIRLVEESNRRAAREQAVSEISSQIYQRSGSVESILQGALGQLSNVLGTDNVSLRLGSPPAKPDRQLGRRVSDETRHAETKPNGMYDDQPALGAGDDGDADDD